MKKWMYVIFPAVALAVFVFFYLDSRKKIEAVEAQKIEQVKEQKAADDARKALIEKKAAEDALQRAEERAKEERDAAAKKESDYQEGLARIRKDTDEANARIGVAAEKIKDLEAKLQDLHTQKDSLTTETFNLEKQIEAENVARRDAEMEIQRMVDMIAQRADASAMAKAPPAPPPAS